MALRTFEVDDALYAESWLRSLPPPPVHTNKGPSCLACGRLLYCPTCRQHSRHFVHATGERFCANGCDALARPPARSA